jgi:hypothetical protein
MLKSPIKRLRNINWKYIVGEILLIFVGINLAIWFNNWNSSTKSDKAKRVAIQKIKEEIQSNLKELEMGSEINRRLVDAFNAYGNVYIGNSSEIIASPAQRLVLEQKYPHFFRVQDSVSLDENKYRYTGVTFIGLELIELTQIAWETTKTLSIANEFNYDCLYELESMYNLQGRFMHEIDAAGAALQKRELKRLMQILDFAHQLEEQLEEDYQAMLQKIDNCD